MKKRILSILLTLCMVLMLCPVTAFAEDYYTVTINFKYGTLANIPEAENPHTFTVAKYEFFMLTTVENCAPYECVGWKESVSGTVYEPWESLPAANLTFDAVYQVQGSLAVTVDGFEVGNTPADCTYSFESTIPGVEFSEDDIQHIRCSKFVFINEEDDEWLPMGETEAFEAGARYWIGISLNNKGLELAPAVTVNGKTPEYCTIATSNGVPIQLQIDCYPSTPAEQSQYTITYDGGEGVEGSIPAGTKTHGTDFTLSSETFTMDGFVQTGWATSDGGEKVYDLGGTYTTNEDITLYPVWSDITKPTGEISIGTKSWKTFLNNITFGLFFKDTQTVTITASDNSGDTVTIEYLLSDNELTVAQLDSADFTAYNELFSINPDNKYVIYAKLTDKSGNVAYINTSGIVLDATDPIIKGLENGKTYCEAQTVTVTEEYIESVKVNGTAVTLDANNQFTLNPAEGTQTIVVTDKAGNETTVTVTVNDGHTDVNTDHACDYCDTNVGTHEDINLDHKCDYGCSEAIGVHEDINLDHKCDYGCNVSIGTHEDINLDHKCDYGCSEAIGTHEDINLDHKCDYGCNEAIGVHEDTNSDHKCDYGCSEVIGTHEDINLDHKCDYGCNVSIGTHEDTNSDHKCDYGCSEAIGTHEDINLDHKCDYGCNVSIGTHEDTNSDHKCDYGCSEAIGAHEDINLDHKCDYGCSEAIGVHEDTNSDHKCDYGCNVSIGTHEDTNSDHKCDYGCSEAIGAHEDINLDHKCDYGCNEAIGVHEDTNSDHICEYCSAEITTCIDNDKNHICDICSKALSSHTGGEATCTSKAICEYCKTEYGEFDSSNHNLEKIRAKDATVTATGNKEYWHCKDCKKYFSDAAGTNEIKLDDTIISKLSPEIIEGKGQSITAGEKKELTFKSNAAFSDFIRAQLDGKTLEENNYTVKEGSTVVTLKADYVDTLSVGEHTIGIVSESGTATTTFTVNAKAVVDNDTKSPQTGDNSHMALWLAVLFVSGGALIVTGIYSRKNTVKTKN